MDWIKIEVWVRVGYPELKIKNASKLAFAKPFYRLPSPVLIKQAVLKGETEMTWGGFDKKTPLCLIVKYKESAGYCE